MSAEGLRSEWAAVKDAYERYLLVCAEHCATKEGGSTPSHSERTTTILNLRVALIDYDAAAGRWRAAFVARVGASEAAAKYELDRLLSLIRGRVPLT